MLFLIIYTKVTFLTILKKKNRKIYIFLNTNIIFIFLITKLLFLFLLELENGFKKIIFK